MRAEDHPQLRVANPALGRSLRDHENDPRSDTIDKLTDGLCSLLEARRHAEVVRHPAILTACDDAIRVQVQALRGAVRKRPELRVYYPRHLAEEYPL